MNATGRAWRRFRPDRLYLKFVLPTLAVVLLLESMWWWFDVREREVHFPCVILINIVLGWFALVRARRNIPHTYSGYRSWLATTPWTINDPLPFGPIELDWPDLVILGLFIAVNGVIPGHESAKLLALFFLLHNLALVPTIRGAANNVPAYAALFGLGLMVKLWPFPWACALTGVVVYLIVYDGLRLTLRKFPEPGDEMTIEAAANFNPATAPCGWPHDRLLREPVGSTEGERPPAMTAAEIATMKLETMKLDQIPIHGRVRIADAMAWGLLLGWWVACVGPIFFPDDRHQLFLLAAVPIFATVCGLVRLGIYTNSHQPPISGWGRILTLRWIIPGHDIVYIGPILTLAVPVAMLSVGVWRGLPMEVVGPSAIAATLFTALATPPSLRRWRLVGAARIVPSSATSEGGPD